MAHRRLGLMNILPALAGLLLITGCSKEAEQSLSFADAARMVDNAEIAVNVSSLSDVIIKRQGNYHLFDVRAAAEYANDHIKTAENITGSELLSDERLQTLNSGRNIYLYSSQSDKAAQLAVLLRAQGIAAYYLQGGYQAWTGMMVNVSSSSSSASAQAKQQAVACWFEGDYVANAGLVVKSGTKRGGYVPPLEPVGNEPRAAEDPLGLGLGLGLGPEGQRQPAAAEPQSSEDPLGLGLGIGLGPEELQKTGQPPAGGTLKIGEGC